MMIERQHDRSMSSLSCNHELKRMANTVALLITTIIMAFSSSSYLFVLGDTTINNPVVLPYQLSMMSLIFIAVAMLIFLCAVFYYGVRHQVLDRTADDEDGGAVGSESAALARYTHIRSHGRTAQCPVAGGSMRGIGACTYKHFGPDDFQAHAWANEQIIMYLRRSGCAVDVILTAQSIIWRCTYMGAIPLALILPAYYSSWVIINMVPFTLTDWYGPINNIDTNRCIIILCCSVALHALAVANAYYVREYDRTASVEDEEEMISDTNEMNDAAEAADDDAEAGKKKTKHAAHVAFGDDPEIKPLQLYCIVALGSYFALGWQAYVSFDESLGRQYGIYFCTSNIYWPPSAGSAPLYTLVLCILTSIANIIPVARSIKLCALLMPKRVEMSMIGKENQKKKQKNRR